MIETEDLYARLNEMAEEERINLLDPICEAVRGKVEINDGMEILANRIFALAVLDLYGRWQQEIFDRN